MRTIDVVAIFGSKAKVARKLGISKAAVTRWGDTVPKVREWQIEILCRGKLKAERLPKR